MSKQDAPKDSPQQLSLDLNPGTADARASSTAQVSCVRNFIDSSTLSIRKQALERVKAAKIFPVPSSRSR
jgi:hypothetical protein